MVHKYLKSIGILSLFSILSCEGPKTSSPDNDKVNDGLSLSYEVLENFYDSSYNVKSRFTIINNTDTVLVNKDWEIYFNFCRKVGQDSLNSKNVDFEHVNGDLFKFKPTKEFNPLAIGDTAIIDFVADAWVTTIYEAPQGVYLVKNGEATLISDYSVVPFTRPEQLSRCIDDVMKTRTPQVVYDLNTSTKYVETELPPFLPTPHYYTYNSDTLNIKSFVIDTDGDFSKEAEKMVKYLDNISFSGVDDVPVKFKKVTSLPVTTLSKPEGYKLLISKEEGIVIEALNSVGAFYAIQSLKSILLNAVTSKEGFFVPELVVVDQPEFEFRGMHLDVGRNFQKKEAVLKLIDMMSFYKLNKFHFHITDDEGWRLEIPGLPELTDVGSKRGHTDTELEMLRPAYGSGPDAKGSTNYGSGYYSKADFIEILKYATERYIEVIPEVDVPGHARSAIVAMKSRYNNYKDSDMAKATEYVLHDEADKSTYSSVQMYNDNVVCVCQQSTFDFIAKVIDEIKLMYTEAKAPLTTIHTGGDEVPSGVWKDSPNCAELVAENPEDSKNHLMNHFLKKVSTMINEKGLVTSGWEEIALKKDKVLVKTENGVFEEKEVHIPNSEFLNCNFQPNVWNNVWGWGGEAYAYQLANAGYPVVMSNATNLYFDLCYEKNPLEPGYYWAGFVNSKTVYEFTPFDVYKSAKVNRMGGELSYASYDKSTRLTSQGKNNIKGIQGQLWSETIMTGQNRMEYMLYPRLTALAERAWAKTPTWSQEEDHELRKEMFDEAWSGFATKMGVNEYNVLTQQEVSFRVPTPGAKIEGSTLYANVIFPGLEIRYTLDGTKPTKESNLYLAPVQVKDGIEVKLAVFVPNSGKSSRVVNLYNN